jgi:hypothetical protein
MLDPDIFPPSHMCGSPTLYDSTRHYDLTLAPVMTHAHEIRPWSNAVAILFGVIIIECVKSVLFAAHVVLWQLPRLPAADENFSTLFSEQPLWNSIYTIPTSAMETWPWLLISTACRISHF